VTCLVGKNESGKTALLKALHKLKPDETSKEQFVPSRDYPKRKWRPDVAPPTNPPAITTTWQLDNADVADLEKKFGVGVIADRPFTLAKGFDNDRQFSIKSDEEAAVKHLIGDLGLSEEEKTVSGGFEIKSIQKAVAESGAPEGVFSLLFGPGRDVGMALVKHPLIKAVGFTGSRAGGRALMDAAAARPEPIPVYAEMGSINPVFILPAAMQQNAEALATGLYGLVMLGVGQFCTNPGLVFIEPKPASKNFLQKLESLMATTPTGTMLTPSICSEYHAGIEKFSKTPGVQRITQTTEGLQRNGQAHATLFATDAETFLAKHELMDEVFGPSTLVVHCGSKNQMLAAAEKLEGQLTATIHGTPDDFAANADLIAILETKVGRLVCNGYPTGVEVCHAMNHGGPYPATADGRSTSVGTRAILRFARPVCYQNFPDPALPDELKESNPLGIWRLVDGQVGKH